MGVSTSLYRMCCTCTAASLHSCRQSKCFSIAYCKICKNCLSRVCVLERSPNRCVLRAATPRSSGLKAMETLQNPNVEQAQQKRAKSTNKTGYFPASHQHVSHTCGMQPGATQHSEPLGWNKLETFWSASNSGRLSVRQKTRNVLFGSHFLEYPHFNLQSKYQKTNYP